MLAILSALLPIATLVVMLTVVKAAAYRAALVAFAVGAAEALWLHGQSVRDVLACAWTGAATGLFPIGLVIIAALFTYAITVESGAIAEIKDGLKKLSDDRRFFVLLTVWGFGNFMEGMAGFGTAVAVPCAILVGVGFDPLKAVLCCLVANTTPTAFGSVGVPTMVLASETALDLARLSSTIAVLQIAATALTPFLLVYIVDGRRGLRETWGLAALSAVAFLVPWLLVAATLGCELPDIVGGLCVMATLACRGNRESLDARRQLWAWLPFGFVVILLALAAALPLPFKISPGFLILAAAFAGGRCQRVPWGRLAKLLLTTLRTYALALVTICLVLALAKVMGHAGMTRTLASALVAMTGRGYAAVASVVGSLGGFVTGSGTSSNVLFGALQASAGASEAQRFLFAAANVMGAGIGKMVCPQSIVLGCAAAGLAGRESEVMKAVFRYFLIVLAVACLATCAMTFCAT